MLGWGVFGAAMTAAALGGVMVRHRARRAAIYRELAAGRRKLASDAGPMLALAGTSQEEAAAFEQERIAVVEGALTAGTYARLKDEALANRGRIERSYVPLHKQGGTVAYEAMHRHAPGCLALYHSGALRRWLSGRIGAEVWPTADHDQSSCSLLCYTKAGDHIDWHYDHNFYRGRHFTVLTCLVNESASGGLSHGLVRYRDLRSVEHTIELGPSTLVVLEGARIRHKVTELAPQELRVVLSMTFGTDPRVAPGRELIRRIKDTAFYGARALWD